MPYIPTQIIEKMLNIAERDIEQKNSINSKLNNESNENFQTVNDEN